MSQKCQYKYKLEIGLLNKFFIVYSIVKFSIVFFCEIFLLSGFLCLQNKENDNKKNLIRD